VTTLVDGELDIVHVREWGTTTIRCSAEVAARIHADGHASVAPAPEHGTYELRARHKVGVLRYGNLELRISPKVPVSRLLYLSSYDDATDEWKRLETLLDDVADPLSAIAEALAYFAERALRPTPLQGYVVHEEAERRLRGRILFDRQISSRAGLVMPVELRFDEYELGIIENRVLKAALMVVEQAVVGGQPALRRRLTHLRFQLDGVEPWTRGLQVPDISFSRMNERYRPALVLSRLVLGSHSLEFPNQKHRGTGFLFDMNRIFESFLEAALRKELERVDGQVRGQERVYLDEAGTVLMKPDITWWRRGRCSAVIDAKYKRATSQDYPNADAYQMLAYCTRLGLRRGWLVYADIGEASSGTTIVRGPGIELVVRAVDIGGTIEQLEAGVAKLAHEIVEEGPND
jgi:5-methylcytosine-specific restriction enzyme subunit McrC